MDSSHTMVVRTATPESLLMGVATVVMGWAAATVHGNGEVLPAVLCLFFAVFMQLYNNWGHRYYDIKYKFGEYIDDRYDLSDNKVLDSYNIMHQISNGALVMAGMVGIGIMMIAGWWTIVIGLLVYACGWLNSHGANPVLRTRANVFMTFLVFGPIGVIGTELVQSATGHTGTDFLSSFSNNLTWFDLGPAVMLCVPAGLMALSAHLAHGLTKFDSDTDNEKKTFQTFIGRKATAWLYLLSAILVPVCFVLFKYLCEPTPALGWLLICPILVTIFMVTRFVMLKQNDFRSTRLIEVETSWAYLFLAIGTYILCLSTGSPNDSPLLYYSAL